MALSDDTLRRALRAARSVTFCGAVAVSSFSAGCADSHAPGEDDPLGPGLTYADAEIAVGTAPMRPDAGPDAEIAVGSVAIDAGRPAVECEEDGGFYQEESSTCVFAVAGPHVPPSADV